MSAGIQRDEHPEWLGQPVWNENTAIPDFITEARATKKLAYSAKPTINEWGALVSVGLPIITDGKVVGILGVDYNISHINALERSAQIAFGLAFIVVIAAVAMQSLINFRLVLTPLRKQAAEESLRTMLDAMPPPCIFLDNQGKAVDCNPAALKLFGATEKEALLQHYYYDWMPEFQPDGEKSLTENLGRIQTALETGYHFSEWMYTTAAREQLPAEVMLAHIKLNGIDYIANYIRDLRGIKAAAQEMSEAEERVRVMFDATPLACSLWNEEGVMLDCNQRALDIFGLSEKSDYIDHFYDLNPEFQPDGEATADKAARLISAAFETGYQEFEWLYLTAQGEPLPVETTLIRVRWKDGFRITACSRDLREAKSSELKMREAEERVRLMLDATPMACSLRDERGGILECNQEMLRMFGFSSKVELLASFPNLDPEIQPDGTSSREKSKKIFQAAFEEGYQRFEWMYLTSSGEELPVETICVRVSWQGGYRIAVYSRDLREIKANEQKMREADRYARELEIEATAAQAASEAKTQFLASMSHEIRTPMNAILGMSDLMRTDNLDPTQYRYFLDIQRMSHALLTVINDILDFSKIEAGKMELLPVDYDIRLLYDNICTIIQFTASGKSLEFRHSLAQDIPPVLFGDEVRVRQIIVNLANNAVKYTQRGYVELRLERTEKNGGAYLGITVEDSGIGIKKEDFSKLFDRFERVSALKNRGITGTGLGLSIVRSLVEMMDGEIILKSEYGRGSGFTVLLPLLEGNPGNIIPADGLRRAMALPGLQVLVVDDNNINVVVALGFLSRHGIQAETAESGAAALKMVQERQYDLIFMDHMMPEMDGVETTRRLRRLGGAYYARVPVIALSANVLPDARKLFSEAGMNDFIAKPIDAFELNAVLVKWLPPDKLSFPEGALLTAPAPAPEGDEEDAAILDQDDGIIHCQNDQRLYQKILTNFLRDHQGYFAEFKNRLAAGESQTAYRLAHTLKSSAALIGAKRLRRAALAIEAELANGGHSVSDSQIETLDSELRLVLEELARLLPEPPGDLRERGALEPERALALLETLEPLLRSCSGKCLELLDEVKSALSPLGAEYDSFAAQLDDLDFSGALETLPAIRQAVLESGNSQ
jgi:PAS domain S-box-containing protein